jgi:tRNA dimethylallyltransferase
MKIIFPIQEPIVALIGPTAIGKTALSIELAQNHNFEIISVDSMQVYKYMDIGTAKISQDEMQGVPHHLIDVVFPDQDFDAVLFEKMALAAVQDILTRGKRVLLTGGTGLYLQSLLEGLSQKLPNFPEIRKELERQLEREGCEKLHDQLSLIDHVSAKRIHKNDTHRLLRAIEINQGTGKKWSDLIQEHANTREMRFSNFLTIGLTCERQQLYKRIGHRTEIMLDCGFEEEVKKLLNSGYNETLKSMRSIGYSHMVKKIKGEWTHETMIEKLTRDTRRYAKRQYTWFNRMEDIKWFDSRTKTQIEPLVARFINNPTLADWEQFPGSR